MSRRFLASLLFLVLAVVLRLVSNWFLGAWVNFPLAALVASAAWLGFFEILFLASASVFLLSWPAFEREFFLLLVLPLVAYFLRRVTPLKPWLANLLFILVFTTAVYLIFGLEIVLSAPRLFIIDMAGSLIFGALAFKALSVFRDA